jgi:hypothetical protein
MSQASGEDRAVYLAQALHYPRDYLTIWTPQHLSTGEFSGILCAFLLVLPTLGKTFRLVWQKSSAAEKNKIKICYYYRGCTTHAVTSRQVLLFFIYTIQNKVSPPPLPPLAVAKAGNHDGQVKDHLPPHWDRRAIKPNHISII